MIAPLQAFVTIRGKFFLPQRRQVPHRACRYSQPASMVCPSPAHVVGVLAADGLKELPADEVSNLESFSAHSREILSVVVAKSMLRRELKRRIPNTGGLTLSESGPAQVSVV